MTNGYGKKHDYSQGWAPPNPYRLPGKSPATNYGDPAGVNRSESDLGTWLTEVEHAPKPSRYSIFGQKWLMDLLGRNFPKMPVRGIAGMSEGEEMGQGILKNILEGGAFQDPRTSPLYEGLRKEIDIESSKGVSDIRRRSQLGGMLYSTPSARTEADYLANVGAKKTSILGGLFEAERARDNPYTRLAASQQFGGLPREIEQAEMDAKYSNIIQKLMAPYTTQAQIAQILSGLGLLPKDKKIHTLIQN